MDKFAVDLDQVLNDFEYSELTEQHNVTRPRTEPPGAPDRPPAALTKHSINNVFHSLNEYLNTGVDLPEPERVPVEGRTPPSDPNDEITEERKDCDAGEPVIENDGVVQEECNGDEDSDVRDGLTGNVEIECTENGFESSTDGSRDAKQSINVLVELEVDAEVNKRESDEIVRLEKNDSEETIAKDTDEGVVGFREIEELNDEEVQDLLAELENDEELLSNDKEEDKSNNLGTNKEDCKVMEEESESTIESKDEHLTVHTEESTTTTIEENTTGIQLVVSNNEEPINTEGSTATQSAVIEDNASEDSDDYEEAIGVPEPTEIPQEVPKPSTIPITEEVPKPEATIPITEEVPEPEATIPIAEEVPELEATINATEEAPKPDVPDEAEAARSSTRPEDLPIKGPPDQREIDLIGAPGSTPYNNVYVADEMKRRDVDDDESTSSFSDTASTGSTASTEEMRDEHPPAPREASGAGDDGLRAIEASSGHSAGAEGGADRLWLGKEAPLWIPDSDTTSCLQCDMKFTVLKRRHHCRACGLVLCSKCCHVRFKLEYLDAEARICNKCHDILNREAASGAGSDHSDQSQEAGDSSPVRRPNPNNPSEYCSTVSPLQQVGGTASVPLPPVMVPVGVLKRKGSNKSKSNKSVMFCDGIRPGSDLTNLDNDFNYNNTKTKKLEKTSTQASAGKINRNLPLIDSETNSFIPKNENNLPPSITITKNGTDVAYADCANNSATVELLKTKQLTFSILLNLYVHVKIIEMDCCIKKTAWCFSTEGLINVGQDELVYVLEFIDGESTVPKDIFYHVNSIYADAVKGTSIKELSISLHNCSNFLDSKNHAGFVYIRSTFQCLENIIRPKEPFLIGILIHRWETPWAKLFPLRLVLRLGAEYRYYPSPILSTRHRDSVFVEIGHTIINLLADFRNFSYTLPQINGLTIHMEDKNTTMTIPINRYDQIIKSLNNSSDHILAFGGCFSQEADSHLVCIQDTQGLENCYSTHAINIQNRPRKVTGASFIVFNGALKSSSGLTAKSNIVEDGLMIQVPPEHMQRIRDRLRSMKNHAIRCGCVDADTDETVNIVWGENDANFNIGVTSSIDGTSLSGVPSIRVHNGKNHYGANGNRIIRWTEVFIIEDGGGGGGEATAAPPPKNHQDQPLDVSKVSEGIAKATCDALLNYLDLLVTNNFQKIGVRTTLHADSVSYCAGSNNTKLPPIYMKSLDNELIPVLHRITSNNLGESSVILELVFRILNV
ncbi:unnamed protein product [Phyllotreta striolata]|uniref:FYVE-type domain-containing protein n=1 Tax=Phyllotreta striolata TaxID=444603 RepID=A0A9N9XQ24_PHYSR|nr:unnamed protein product [Phyllotreta striolata]